MISELGYTGSNPGAWWSNFLANVPSYVKAVVVWEMPPTFTVVSSGTLSTFSSGISSSYFSSNTFNSISDTPILPIGEVAPSPTPTLTPTNSPSPTPNGQTPTPTPNPSATSNPTTQETNQPQPQSACEGCHSSGAGMGYGRTQRASSVGLVLRQEHQAIRFPVAHRAMPA